MSFNWQTIKNNDNKVRFIFMNKLISSILIQEILFCFTREKIIIMS